MPKNVKKYPDTFLGEGVKVGVDWGELEWVFSFEVLERAGEIFFPVFQKIRKVDRLWESTCFEVFLGKDNGPEYLEWNFSPCGGWNGFLFADYRKRVPDFSPLPPEITLKGKTLIAKISSQLVRDALKGEPTRYNLTAVLKEPSGKLRYLALKDPGTPPDFHNRQNFQKIPK